MALGSDPVPVAPYVSNEYFALETQRIFRRAWLNVGRAQELPEPGCYLVREIPGLGVSLLLTLDAAGSLRAFHNTCTHRANRLVRGCGGRARRFVCGYHGWTFDGTGSLRAVPDETQFGPLDKAKLGLKSVAMDCWNGFIFVNLASPPHETLAQSMDELNLAFQDYPFERMERVATYTCTVDANWKTCMDIGSEAYHVRFVHRASAPDSHVSVDNPLAHLPYAALYRRHRSTSLRANPQHRLRPAEAIVARRAPTVMQGGGQSASCLNPGRAADWAFDTHILFPNFGLLLASAWYVTHLYWPVSAGRTRWETTLYTFPPASAGERLSQEFSAVLTRDLIREDWAQVERVQLGLQSGALTHLQFSDQEVLLRHAAKVIDDIVSGRVELGGVDA